MTLSLKDKNKLEKYYIRIKMEQKLQDTLIKIHSEMIGSRDSLSLTQKQIHLDYSLINSENLNQYGRFNSDYFFELYVKNSKLPLSMFYLQSQDNNFSENQNIFSFDRSQSQIIEENLEHLKNNLPGINFENSYMISRIELDKNKKKTIIEKDEEDNNKIKSVKNQHYFNLTSKIFLNNEFDQSIHTALHYLKQITNNPIEILQNKKLQQRFDFAQKQLKKQSISLEQLFSLYDTFNPQSQLKDFSIIDSQGSFYHITANNVQENPNNKIISNNNILLTNKQIENNDLERLLWHLSLSVDNDKIEKMKSTEREKVLGTNQTTKKRSLKALKSTINQTLESDSKNELFSLNAGSTPNKIIEILSNEQLLKYFPFKSEKITDIVHLSEFISQN